MYTKTIFVFFFLSVLSTGCGINISSESTPVVIPEFITVTLPPSPIPQATMTLTLPAPIATATTPTEGTTTTQVNVRAQTSTASETLGMINQFSKVQITGKDASGSWYQIVFSNSVTGNGWVRAEYVQVDAAAQIPVVGSVTGNESGVSGLVIQKINVRNGPATSYDSLGVLNPKDVVFITGKDPSGAWMKIEFPTSPDGSGWAALEFLQVNDVDNLPVIGATSQPTQAAANTTVTQVAVMISALQDGDSKQSPLASTSFSPIGTSALQVNGDVSTPDGDKEDWIQFTSFGKAITIQLTCSSSTFSVELWNNITLEKSALLSCGEKKAVTIDPSVPYFLRLSEAATDLHYTHYTLSLEALP